MLKVNNKNIRTTSQNGQIHSNKSPAVSLRPAILLKKRPWHRCFPVSIAKFLRISFFTEHLWTLLSHIDVYTAFHLYMMT